MGGRQVRSILRLASPVPQASRLNSPRQVVAQATERGIRSPGESDPAGGPGEMSTSGDAVEDKPESERRSGDRQGASTLNSRRRLAGRCGPGGLDARGGSEEPQCSTERDRSLSPKGLGKWSYALFSGLTQEPAGGNQNLTTQK